MYRCENYTTDDIEYILDNLRKEDRLEVIQNKGENYKEIILDEISKNKDKEILVAKTKNDNTPVLIHGCWGLYENPSIGIIWMLSTPEIVNHQKCFLREMKKELKKIDEKFGLTLNQLYKENYIAKNWLKWVGFRFPAEEKIKNLIDKEFLKANIHENFEIFYRERNVKGLGE